MTDIKKVFCALNGWFLNSETNRINEEYLNEQVELWGMNTESLYNSIVKSNRKLTSVTFEVFGSLAQNAVNQEYYPEKISVSNYQLKKWLETYGNGYDSLKDSVEYFESERLDYKA